MKKNAIVLAAGKGTRMKSDLPKVVHEVLGKPMVKCVYDNLKKSGVDRIIPVIGFKKEEIEKVLPAGIDYAIQAEQLGTGHAVLMAEEFLKDEEGVTIVLAGDQPLISDESIQKVIDFQLNNNVGMSLLTAENPTPFGYGRIIRDEAGNVVKIVEQKDCTEEEARTTEVNISTFCFDNKLLFKYIHEIGTNNAQGEMYLTDLVEIFIKHGHLVGAVKADSLEETIGINDKVALAKATNIKKRLVNERLMRDGVTIIDPENTYIHEDVEVGSGTIVYPGTYIMGESKVGMDCEIKSSYIIDSEVGDGVVVGPFAHLRGHAVVKDNCRIGNFVEIKKSTLDENTKAAHLTYVGDAEVGKNVNFGCGVITVNYDGKNKHKTIIEDNAFIGSNVNLVAPVTVGEGALLAAGSTVNKDVPSDALAIARSKQTNKEGYAKVLRDKINKEA
jgi:bifunctional UDP-N-acetylglucosamine pyrophosphorylase/glucosamine-1-phosphate N-acetyltransferase